MNAGPDARHACYLQRSATSKPKYRLGRADAGAQAQTHPAFHPTFLILTLLGL
ncbi:MAG TPA: hypothetical protein VKB88_01895 [Bryobacteraceae bacterium]|nr:hypothetical protein [Bryobacteraceae bacterium]